MTTENIKELQILAITDNEETLLTTSDNRLLIDIVADLCEFVKVKKELVITCRGFEIIDLDKMGL